MVVERASDVSGLINRLHGEGAVYLLPFAGQEGLLGQIAEVIETTVPGQYRRS